MTRKRIVQRRRLTGRRKADKRQRIGSSHPPGTEAGIYDAVIAQVQTTEQAAELISHLENEMKKTKSPALRRRLEVAITSTKEWKQQLQIPVESKSRPAKPRQLYVGFECPVLTNWAVE